MIFNLSLVAIGGFLGAMSRFGVSNFIKSTFPSVFPIATLTVNLLGSFLLGLCIGASLDNSWRLLLGTGFLGAFTTFSTFKLENIQLHSKRKWNIIIPYLIISYTFGILLAFLGIKLGGI
ncbi:fluoride efflux transporter CrcB [Neobacillus terrae]|uniref:fluoride efflux transporter CrcB n=1 Tax=Neobacillus terrae TaxID=3034837 RepID=UPI00140C4652|nr:fluoride efflux transporter CrcB [Neobacillus terrae]NHM33208.1 fluoride efflux transporter CrcB [Neobacillus terrae]